MWQTFALLEACIPRLKATVTARSWHYLWFHQFQWALIYRNPQNCCTMCSFFFRFHEIRPRIKCCYASDLHSIYMNIWRIISCDLCFDISIVLLSLKAFSNQLIKPLIFNQLSSRVLYFTFFSASVTRLHINCIAPELVPADLDTRELNHNRSTFFIKWTLQEVISCIWGEQALEFSLLSCKANPRSTVRLH